MDAPNTGTSTISYNNNQQYALYQPEYDADEYNPQWHTNKSPPRNSFGQLMGLTETLTTDSTTPLSIVPTDVRPDHDTPAPVVRVAATMPAPIQEVRMVNEFDQLEWSSCDYDTAGTPIGYDGKLWSQFQVAKLRCICSKLQVYGVKNARKHHIMDAIVNTYNNLQAYSTMKQMVDNQQGAGGTSTTTRKEVQCPYRLMNILFSDDFAEEFANIGNSASRHTLDVGKAAYESGFWTKVE
jgi:hypothetical protein